MNDITYIFYQEKEQLDNIQQQTTNIKMARVINNKKVDIILSKVKKVKCKKNMLEITTNNTKDIQIKCTPA